MMNPAPLLSRCFSPVLLTAIALSSLSITAHAERITTIYEYTSERTGHTMLTNIARPNANPNKTTLYRNSNNNNYQKADFGSNNYGKDNYGSNSYGTSAASNSGSRNAYDSYIRASATRHGVDPGLMKAMMHTESAFNPNARSPVGAQGLMQLMPATARRFNVANAWNPAENIEGSAKYIAWLMKRFNNNVEFAVAGYNAGEGNVDKYGGIPPFKETRNYVQKVMSRYHSLYKNDASFSVSNANVSSGMRNVSYGTSNNNNSASYAKSAFDALGQ